MLERYTNQETFQIGKMRTKFKAWAEPFINEHPEVMFTEEQLLSFKEPYFLEIGSGKGQFLLDMANKFPQKFFVGVERNVTCAGITAKKLVENETPNAKLMYLNAEVLLPNIKDNSIEGIILNFSDPWPKKRHHKRRLTAISYLNNYYRVLKPNGRLMIKTDNTDLFEFTKENIEQTKFKVIYLTENYVEYDEFDSMTEYEKSFREEGVAIHRIVLEKQL